MNSWRIAAALTLASTIALSGCGRDKHEEPENDANAVVEVWNNMADMNVAEPATPTDSGINHNTAKSAPPPPPVAQDQQVLEDAEASGMTARLPSTEPDTGASAPDGSAE